jgi:protease IV
MSEQESNSCYERESIAIGITEIIKELKRARRWRNIWRGSLVALLGLCFAWGIFTNEHNQQTLHQSHTALIDINGVIMDNQPSDADNVVSGLSKAFKNAATRGIILRINSPGGSGVQASYIYNAIRQLRREHKDIPLVAVCVDMCASAAYYIASAADQIYANPMSEVGSIGVLVNGFGFVDTIKKLGIERRLFTSGKDKAELDPFSPLATDATARLQQTLHGAHQIFIHDVQQGRGTRLQKNAEIFTGRLWLAADAKKLGLIDGYASAGDIARNLFKQTRIIDYTVKPNYLERFVDRFGAMAIHEAIQSVSQAQHLRLQA